MTTLAPIISSTGIATTSYTDMLTSLKASFQNIFGSDIALDNDTQDGEMLAIFALAMHDVSDAVVSAYNAFSPATAQGVGLSSQVKINGIARLAASNSSTPVVIVGQSGTQLTGGLVGDDQNLNTQWSLPATVDIPPSGTITVTATCTTPGSVAAAAGTLTRILTPTAGWQSVTNPSAASLGDAVETDAALRVRQSNSVSIAAVSITSSIEAAIANISGVTRSRVYENDTESADANGLPAHSISCVVEGGDVATIATAIWTRKTPGTTSYGTTSYTVYDAYGLGTTINYYSLATVPIYVTIGIKALTNYLSTTADKIKAAISLMLSSAGIGEDIYYGRIWPTANLSGTYAIASSGLSQSDLDAISSTYKITSVSIGTSASPTGTSDIPIAFNLAALGNVSNIVVNLT